jgi:Uma2 family endonuclease
MIIKQPPYTPEDLLTLPDGDRYELVDGQLVETHVSILSSLVGGELHTQVNNFSKAHNSGLVWPADNFFQCFPHAPNRVRKPDVAFIRRGRLTLVQLEEGICRIAPDLVAEVVSPNDLFDEVEIKIDDYLKAGVPLVWVVSLKPRWVYVHRLNGSVSRIREHEELNGEDVLPGFRCLVSALFPKPEDVEQPANSPSGTARKS